MIDGQLVFLLIGQHVRHVVIGERLVRIFLEGQLELGHGVPRVLLTPINLSHGKMNAGEGRIFPRDFFEFPNRIIESITVGEDFSVQGMQERRIRKARCQFLAGPVVHNQLI